MTGTPGEPPSIGVLGVRVHMVQMPEVLTHMEHWVQRRERAHVVVASGMHGVMEARRNPEFKDIVNSADLFVPDGISLVWIGRRRGYRLKKRVCGSDLMWEFLKLSERKGYRLFFYGDTEETLESLTDKLKMSFPHLKIVGSISPPFRPLTAEEESRDVETINRSGADVVWVGLGLPKQERWMYQHRDKVDAPVLVGVGAAFKFLSGQVRRAPPWVGDNGLEWMWRFIQEPRRVWRRVLVDGPKFAGQVILELSGLKKYS